MATMREFAAKDAKNHFGQLLDAAQAAPVRVTRNGRPAGVLMSGLQYDRLRGMAWDRLMDTADAMAAQANLSDAQLDDLLADES